jgi:hypothetical protein
MPLGAGGKGIPDISSPHGGAASVAAFQQMPL